MIRWRLIVALLAMLLPVLLFVRPVLAEPDYFDLSMDVLIGSDTDRARALEVMVAQGDTMIPTLVLLMRIGGAHVATQAALKTLTGHDLPDWHAAMKYQEANPQHVPHPSFDALKMWYLGGLDTDFLDLFAQPMDHAAMGIRFEEITWGGALFDDIPPLDAPKRVPADQADYLLADDLVFGVEINGDARAYPLRILGWHEMVNDVIGGVPVALAYCTLCGAGILFDTQVDGRASPLVFGSSGLLYRSNKLMFDRGTKSLWNQFTGAPVVGPLASSDIRLTIRPTVITTWSKWRADHPHTTVLSLDTGHIRNYDSGFVYREYFASPDLMFPTLTDETRLAQKTYIYGIRVAGGAKAWPLEAFAQERVINDQVGFTNVVLIGDAATRTVRAYDRGAQLFEAAPTGLKGLTGLTGPGGAWQITETALIGPKGERAPRVPGHVSYWFAWDGYLGAGSALYVSDQ
ncbi:MAG: DUF3179 domain-containing protein [Pseudomonadota bacterium]